MNREAGIVEKLLTSYGFIQCCDRQARLFFHYSQYTGRVEHLKLGDPVEFEMTYDRKTGKPIASSVVKISSGAMFDEQLSQDRVSGFITLEVAADQEGRVVYENRGECFFLPFSEADVENSLKLEAKDEVTFHISTDKSGNLRARCLRMDAPTPAPFRGIVCTLKDRFGFIKRADCDKEIFFHSSGCNNKIFNDLCPYDCVEFDIQTRNGKEVAVNVNRLPAGSVQVEGQTLNDFLARAIEKPSSNSSGITSNNNSSINFSNNNLVSGISSNLTNLFDSIGTSSLSSYQQQQDKHNLAMGLPSSLFAANPRTHLQQLQSWVLKPNEDNKVANLFQEFFQKMPDKSKDDYPLIDLDGDGADYTYRGSRTNPIQFNYLASPMKNGNGQRSGIKCDSWSEILTHLPIDLNLQVNNDQQDELGCAMPYRPEKALTKQYEEQQRGPRVVLVRQPRGPEPGLSFSRRFDLNNHLTTQS